MTGDRDPTQMDLLGLLSLESKEDHSFPQFDLQSFQIPGGAPEHDCETERQRITVRLQQGHKDVVCGVCTQHVGVFKRGLYGTLVRILIKFVHRFEQTGTWVKVTDIGTKGGDYAKLMYWGLLEKKPNENPSKNSSGEFRPTPLGIDMAHGKVTVPKHAYVFVGECYGFGDEWVTIEECLGKKFSVQDIWAEAEKLDSP